VDEMRAEATWACDLVFHPTTLQPTGEVRVTGTYRMFEEDVCGESDEDDVQVRTIVLGAFDGSSSVGLNAFLDNLPETSLDSATFSVNATSNVQF